MTVPKYTPFCGNVTCKEHMPRTVFNGEQFICSCGWKSEFDPEFIAEYKKKWNLP